MFFREFEVDALSRFWRWNLIKIWTCDLMTQTSYIGNLNSTLGSVVPLAMFTNCSQSIYIMKSHINILSQLFGPKGSCPFETSFNGTNKNRYSHIGYGHEKNGPCSIIIIIIIIIIVPLFLLNPVLLKWLLKKWATVAEGAERSTQSPPVLQGEYWLWCFSSCKGENHLSQVWVDVMFFLSKVNVQHFLILGQNNVIVVNQTRDLLYQY